MADERGIQQTKELLDFIFSLIGAIKESTKDGEFTWSDGLNFIEPSAFFIAIRIRLNC